MHSCHISAKDTNHVAKYGENGHDDHAREHARHNEIVHGTDRHDAQGVDLLRDLHGGDLRRDCCAHASRADDTDKDGAELAPNADSDDRANGALRSVADEFVRDL